MAHNRALIALKLPQLHCHYPESYISFIWQNAKQSVKAPGPLVCTVLEMTGLYQTSLIMKCTFKIFAIHFHSRDVVVTQTFSFRHRTTPSHKVVVPPPLTKSSYNLLQSRRITSSYKVVPPPLTKSSYNLLLQSRRTTSSYKVAVQPPLTKSSYNLLLQSRRTTSSYKVVVPPPRIKSSYNPLLQSRRTNSSYIVVVQPPLIKSSCRTVLCQ